MSLSLFGGRGGDSVSARWMGGFFKAASKGAGEGGGDVKAAGRIYRALVREKDRPDVTSAPKDAELALLREWTKRSKAAKFNEDKFRLEVNAGKYAEARREFENFVKNKFWDEYLKGRGKPRRGVHVR